MSNEMTELELLEYYEQAWLNRDLKSNHSLAGHTHNLRVNAEYAAESKGYIAKGYAGNAPAPSRITDKGILRLEQLRHEQTKAQLDELKQASKAVINELRIEQLGPGYIHIWGAKGIYHEFTQQAAYDILHHFLHLVYKKD